VKNDLLPLKRPGNGRIISNIANLQFHIVSEIGRERSRVAMNLPTEVVQDGNGASFAQEPSRQMGADKTSAARNQYIHVD
jgi:hypothetical protein